MCRSVIGVEVKSGRAGSVNVNMANGKLTTKQRLFVEYYLANPNASDAALKAGYSKKTAPSQGQRLLKNVEIAKALSGRVANAVMSANDVLSELTDIATADWREFLQIKRDKDGEIVEASIILKDKIRALELVGKYHKLFTDKQEITGKDGGAIEITEVITPKADES